MPQSTKNAPKKRPIPTKRSPVIKAAKDRANNSAKPGAEDDVTITALKPHPNDPAAAHTTSAPPGASWS